MAWCVCFREPDQRSAQRILGTGDIKSSPLISDLDGDQAVEIVIGYPSRVFVLEGTECDTIAAYCRGVGSDIRSTGAVADLDNDGDLEMVVAEYDSSDPCLGCTRNDLDGRSGMAAVPEGRSANRVV